MANQKELEQKLAKLEQRLDAIKKTDSSASEEKLLLEAEKLRAETEAIRRPFYKTPAFYTSLTPVMLAAFGLVFTWASGWFDVQRTRINTEKLQVQMDTEKLTQKQREQEQRVASLENDLRQLRSERVSLTNQILSLEIDRNEIQKAKELFEKEANRLAGSDTNAQQYLTDLKNLQNDRGALENKLSQAEFRKSLLSARLGAKVEEIKLTAEQFATYQKPSQEMQRRYSAYLIDQLNGLNQLTTHVLFAEILTNVIVMPPQGLRMSLE